VQVTIVFKPHTLKCFKLRKMPAVYDAVKNRDHALLLQALANGHNVDEPVYNSYGRSSTPLYNLVAGPWHDSKPKILQTLLQHGADPELRGGGGYGTSALVCLATNRPFPYDRSKVSWMQMIVQLLDHGVNMDICDWQGESILYYAAQHGIMDLVKLLVERGAEIDISNHGSGASTPLHMAVFHGEVDIARFLVEHGASTVRKNQRGYTASDIARASRNYPNYADAENFALELDNVTEARRIELANAAEARRIEIRNILAIGYDPVRGSGSRFSDMGHDEMRIIIDYVDQSDDSKSDDSG
jgi:ankyrin repeat protein